MAGFRLNPKYDKDIIDDLARFKNMTDRFKEVYRLGLAAERGGAPPTPVGAPLTSPARAPMPTPTEALPAAPTSEETILGNILNTSFG